MKIMVRLDQASLTWHLWPVCIALFALSTLNTQLSTAFAQGSLTPPGAPAPTMKTLDQIEPRIDVAKLTGDVGSHVIISNAGSYYLSANLAVTNTYGIIIAAAGVTLDLNGFEIARVSGSGGTGITIIPSSHRTTLRNGTIRGFSSGVNSSSMTAYAEACLFEKLLVTGCSTFGIFAGNSTRILDCRAYDNAGNGILALGASILSGCTAQTNRGQYALGGGLGSTISDCTAQGNQGVYAILGDSGSTISGCTVQGHQGIYGISGGSGSTLKNCTAQANRVMYGIYSANSAVISGCAAYGNVGTGSSSYGIYGQGGNMIIGCASGNNSNTNSPATSSHGIGIFAGTGSTVKDCNAYFNSGDGIRVTDSCLVAGNACDNNGNFGDASGIHTTGLRNRIEGNTVTTHGRGIKVDLAGSLIIRNSAGNNTTNFVIVANNKVGVIVSAPNSGAISGGTGGAGVGSTDPWANISF